MKSMNRNQESATCPQCERNNQTYHLKFMYISLDEMVLKCESSSCMFPFKNFKYKNVNDGSISQPQLIPEQKTEFVECHTNNTIPERANDTFRNAFVDSLSFGDNSNSDEKKTFINLKPYPTNQYDFPLSYEVVQPESKTAFIDLALLHNTVSEKQTNHVIGDNEAYACLSFPSLQDSTGSSKNTPDEKPSSSQLQNPMNEDLKREQTTATISRYLDFIKAKHKKCRTAKKRQPCEKEVKKFEKSPNNATDKVGNRPLDILKSIQAMK